MLWVLMSGCKLVRESGALSLYVEKMEQMSTSSARPKGYEVNPGLAGPKKEEFEDFLNSSGDGVFSIGTLMPGVGGAFLLPFNCLWLGSDPELILENLQRKFGSIDSQELVMVAVVRGLDAPGDFGVIDGGGAGILDLPPKSPWDLKCCCFAETFGEIGIEIVKEGRLEGRLVPSGYHCLEEIVEKEWETSWGTVPPVSRRVPLNVLSLPDRLVIKGWEEIFQCALAFETENAGCEILLISRLNLEPELKLSFRDLEHTTNGQRLNRSIAVVAKSCGNPFAIFYKAGEFVRDFAVPLTGDCCELLLNEKSKRLIPLALG